MRRRGGRSSQRHVHKIEELRHVRLGRIACGQARQVKASLDQLQHRRVVHNRVGHVVRLCERRNHNQRHPEPGHKKSTDWTRVVGANVRAENVGRILNAVRRDSRLRRHMVVESTGLVMAQNEDRILPRRATHQCVHDVLHVGSTRLHAGCVRRVHSWGVLIETHVTRRLDEGHLRQRPVLHVGRQLRRGGKLIRQVVEHVRSVGELAQVAMRVQAGTSGAATRIRVHIDFPAYAVVLHKLEDGLIGQWRAASRI